ncbi:MAG: hypothetical protein IJM79_07645 [Erysipelotrichaceae bacterium]|nr:hypothetical protein [Erysipelotrichaceae bacterium]
MKKGKTTYYYINDRDLVAKSVGSRHYIFRSSGWRLDRSFIVSDRLCGYDSSEPSGSPYGFGSTDMLDRIDEITREEAMKIIEEQKNKKEEW